MFVTQLTSNISLLWATLACARRGGELVSGSDEESVRFFLGARIRRQVHSRLYWALPKTSAALYESPSDQSLRMVRRHLWFVLAAIPC
jgi:hypothetical protein